jgi:hypothetical protein
VVAVTVSVRGTGRSIAQPTLVTSSTPGGGRRVTFEGRLPLAGLAPGRYVLEIAGRLADGRPVTRAVPFDVR